MTQMQNAQSVALQLEKVRDKLPLLYERDDILLTMIQQRGDVERVSSRNMRTHGVYHIPGCAKGEAYALLIITARGDALDLGDNRRFPVTITARQIAEDLLQDLHDHGIFICEGARPSSAELATATARREGFYQKLITEGDTMWARGHSFREISDLHRRAAIGLGIEREWACVPMRMSECPACGEKVKVGVAVCRHCSAILDEGKAAKHGLGAGAAAARATRLNANGAPSTEKKSRT
jgi:hypothetical protein